MGKKPAMNRQEVFDTVVAHLKAQNAKSVHPDGQCLYRSPDGLKCAIGCLIPDNKYYYALEWKPASSPSVIAALPFAVTPGQDFEFLERLQVVHDKYRPSEWKLALERTALHHDLTLYWGD